MIPNPVNAYAWPVSCRLCTLCPTRRPDPVWSSPPSPVIAPDFAANLLHLVSGPFHWVPQIIDITAAISGARLCCYSFDLLDCVPPISLIAPPFRLIMSSCCFCLLLFASTGLYVSFIFFCLLLFVSICFRLLSFVSFSLLRFPIDVSCLVISSVAWCT